MSTSAPVFPVSGQTYILTNSKTNTVLDLSQVDKKSVIVFPENNGNNQRWTFTATGNKNSWVLKEVSSGLYLGFDGCLDEGAVLIGQTTPHAWNLAFNSTDSPTWRLGFNFTSLNMTVTNAQGSPAGGPPVILQGQSGAGMDEQRWSLKSV